MSAVEGLGVDGDDEDFEDGELEDSADEEAEAEDGPPRRAPWHFKILAVGTVIYLGWRAYQGIGWLVHHV